MVSFCVPCVAMFSSSMIPNFLTLFPLFAPIQVPIIVTINGVVEPSDEVTQLHIHNVIRNAIQFPLRFLICSHTEA